MDLFFTVLLLLLPLLITKWYYSNSKVATNKKLPPSPPRLPIIGNLHQLGLCPHRTLKSLAQKYGPLMLLHFGQVPVLVVSSADAASEIFKYNDLIFSDRPQDKMWNLLFYGSKNLVTAPYGEYWRQIRSVSVLHLLSNKRVQLSQRVREEEIGRMMDSIKQCCASSLPVNLSELFAATANDIVSRVALGKRYRGEGDGRKFQELMLEFMKVLGTLCIGNYIPWLDWLSTVNGLYGRAERVARALDEFIDEVIEEHIRNGRVDEEDNDFVDVLLSLEKDDTDGYYLDRDTMKGLILDMFVGGTDSTATLLEWTMSELLKYPNVMRKLQDEVRSVVGNKTCISEDDLSKMNYLKAVIKEAFRIHPPIPVLPRKPTKDIKVKGYDISAETHVFINVWHIARDPALWDQPLEFKPERFLNSSIDFRGRDMELLPFGAGRRGCPGVMFANNTIEMAMANLMYQYDWSLPGGAKGEDLDMSETASIVVHRTNLLIVVPTKYIKAN